MTPQEVLLGETALFSYFMIFFQFYIKFIDTIICPLVRAVQSLKKKQPHHFGERELPILHSSTDFHSVYKADLNL